MRYCLALFTRETSLLMLVAVAVSTAQGLAGQNAAPTGSEPEPGGVAVLVTDPQGAVIPDARVQISTGNAKVSGSTDQSGHLTLMGLAPGEFALEVSAQAFLVAHEKVSVESHKITNVEVKLAIAQDGHVEITSLPVVVVDPAPNTYIDSIPYSPVPSQPSAVKRFFGSLFRRLGF